MKALLNNYTTVKPNRDLFVYIQKGIRVVFFFFFDLHFIFKYVSIWELYVNKCRFPQRPEKTDEFLENSVTESFEKWGVGAGNQGQVVCKSCM